MKVIETRINMEATVEQLWDVLMDFPSYPSWNPTVVQIAGQARLGQRLEVTIAMKNSRRMAFKPKVVEFEPGRRFGWLGKVLLPGLLDGLHRFDLQQGSKGTMFVHSEEFRGLFPPLLGSLLRDTHESLETMNDALAREVARRSALATAVG